MTIAWFLMLESKKWPNLSTLTLVQTIVTEIKCKYITITTSKILRRLEYAYNFVIEMHFLIEYSTEFVYPTPNTSLLNFSSLSRSFSQQTSCLYSENFSKLCIWSHGILCHQLCERRWLVFQQSCRRVVFLDKPCMKNQEKVIRRVQEVECSNWRIVKYLPWLRSKTMSLSRTEVMRWAMVITVQSEKCCRSVCWIWLSVAVSTDAVASSSTRTLLFLSRTLPRQTSCLCPILQFSPFSATAKSIFT